MGEQVKSPKSFILNADVQLVFIDLKEANQEEFKKLKPEDIESMNVLKGEEAIKTLGERGKNGIIYITTKKK